MTQGKRKEKREKKKKEEEGLFRKFGTFLWVRFLPESSFALSICIQSDGRFWKIESFRFSYFLNSSATFLRLSK